jgi:hypothetical protein
VSQVRPVGPPRAWPHDDGAASSAMRSTSEGHASDGETSGVPSRMRVVDSHTEGEPTRVVIEGWPHSRIISGEQSFVSRVDSMRSSARS